MTDGYCVLRGGGHFTIGIAMAAIVASTVAMGFVVKTSVATGIRVETMVSMTTAARISSTTTRKR